MIPSPLLPPAAPSMTITGKLNADEDTIFLKVQIADDDTAGHNNNDVRNIYFPFDMVSDTAAEVAEEMVKELEITDREPSEIAAMIDHEIQRLLPNPNREQQQHEYSHDDDDHPPPLYYFSSSPASSQSSLCGVGPYASSGAFPAGPHVGDWAKDRGYYAACLSDDDDSISSMHSGSAMHYDAGHGEEEAQSPGDVVVGQAKNNNNNNTRFGPSSSIGGGQSSSSRGPTETAQKQSSSLAQQLQRQCSVRSPHAGRPRRRDHEEDGNNNRRRRMTRNRSMVDMRSQLLHRTLVEELNRRLFFNTVGAVENIGFRAPTTSSSARGRRSSRDDKHNQYVML